MIQSFADADTEQLFREEKNRRFNAIARVALRKLREGDLHEAVRASCSFPGMFPPMLCGCRRLVSGEVSEVVPVRVADEMAGERGLVVAVD